MLQACRVRRDQTTRASVGVELPVSAAFPVCRSRPGSWGGCWASLLPRHYPHSQKRAIPSQVAKTGAVTDPAILDRRSIPRYAPMLTRRCVCRAIPVLRDGPLGQGASQPNHQPDAHHRPPGGSLSGTARPAGTGCRNSYLASDAVDDDPMTPCWASITTVSLSVLGGAKGVHFKLCRPVVIRFGDRIGKE